MKEAAERHQSTHEMLVKSIGGQSGKSDSIPEAMRQFLIKNAAKALEAVRANQLACEILESEIDSLVSMVLAKRNEMEVEESLEEEKEEEEEHSQCLSYRYWKMGYGDHSQCVYVPWSTATMETMDTRFENNPISRCL